MSSEGNAAHPVGYNSPLQIVMAIYHTFLKLELAGSGVQGGHYYLQRAVTPPDCLEICVIVICELYINKICGIPICILAHLICGFVIPT